MLTVTQQPRLGQGEGFGAAATALHTATNRAIKNLTQSKVAAEDDEDREEIATAIARLSKVAEEIVVIAHKAAKAATSR